MPHRTAVEFGDDPFAYMNGYSERKGCSYKEALTRALALMKRIEEVQDKPGACVLIEDNGVTREIVFPV